MDELADIQIFLLNLILFTTDDITFFLKHVSDKQDINVKRNKEGY